MRLTSNPLIPVSFLCLGLFWGSNFIYMKWAVALISPAQIVLLRVLFGFLPLALMAWRKGVINRAQLRLVPHFLVMAMVATAFYYYAITRGTALLPSGIAGVLGGSISLFTTLATLLFLRSEKLNGLMVVGVILGFAGIAVIARPWLDFPWLDFPGLDFGGSDVTAAGAGAGAEINLTPSNLTPMNLPPINLIGVAWMLGAAAILGLSYVYVRRFLSPHNLPPLALVTWQIGLALLIMLIVTPFAGMTRILDDLHAAAGVAIGLGVLGTGGAFLLYYYLLEKLGAVAASGATYLTPIVALAISWLAGETVGPLEIAAVLLILASIALLQLGRQRAMRGPVQRRAYR